MPTAAAITSKPNSSSSRIGGPFCRTAFSAAATAAISASCSAAALCLAWAAASLALFRFSTVNRTILKTHPWMLRSKSCSNLGGGGRLLSTPNAMVMPACADCRMSSEPAANVPAPCLRQKSALAASHTIFQSAHWRASLRWRWLSPRICISTWRVWNQQPTCADSSTKCKCALRKVWLSSSFASSAYSSSSSACAFTKLP
mmetsp:Transcript_42674/g.118116  ORF Transcript_42674/g.118116 Transcript_42674/m.118116 type:complete len:201 (-) Transcript_42674:62-664(-)